MARPFGNANKILQRARSSFDSVEEHNHEEPLFEVVMGMFAMVGLILLAGIAYLLYQPCKKHVGKYINLSRFRKRRRQSLTPEMGQTFTKIGDHMLSMAHIFRQTSKINEPSEISIAIGSITDERSSEVSDATTNSQNAMEKMKIVFFKERGKVYVSPDIQAIISDIKPKGDGPFYEVEFEHISSGFQSPVHSPSQSINNLCMRPSLSDGCHLGDQLEPINPGLHYDRMMKSWYDLTTISDQQCEAAREQMKVMQQQSKSSERSDPTDASDAYRRKYELFRKQSNVSKQKEMRRCSTKKKKTALEGRSSGGKRNRLRGRDESKKCDPDQHDRKTTMLLNALRIPITKGFIS